MWGLQNAVERVWGMAKRWLRWVSKYNDENFVKKVPIALVKSFLQCIHRFSRKSMDYQQAYRMGLSGPDAGAQIKVFKSHRMFPPWQLKTKIIEQRKWTKMLKLFNKLMMETTQSTPNL